MCSEWLCLFPSARRPHRSHEMKGSPRCGSSSAWQPTLWKMWANLACAHFLASLPRNQQSPSGLLFVIKLRPLRSADGEKWRKRERVGEKSGRSTRQGLWRLCIRTGEKTDSPEDICLVNFVNSSCHLPNPAVHTLMPRLEGQRDGRWERRQRELSVDGPRGVSKVWAGWSGPALSQRMPDKPHRSHWHISRSRRRLVWTLTGWRAARISMAATTGRIRSDDIMHSPKVSRKNKTFEEEDYHTFFFFFKCTFQFSSRSIKICLRSGLTRASLSHFWLYCLLDREPFSECIHCVITTQKKKKKKDGKGSQTEKLKSAAKSLIKWLMHSLMLFQIKGQQYLLWKKDDFSF